MSQPRAHICRRKIQMKRLAVFFILAASIYIASSPNHSGAAPKSSNWSQWRGPEGTGISSETNVPLEWSENKNIKWKSALPGRGHSSAIVWGDKVFLTTYIEGEGVAGAKAVKHVIEGEVFVHPDSVGANRKHVFKVLCLDRNTGKILWDQTAYSGTVFDDRHRKGSYAAPTPATDGKLVCLVRRRG